MEVLTIEKCESLVHIININPFDTKLKTIVKLKSNIKTECFQKSKKIEIIEKSLEEE